MNSYLKGKYRIVCFMRINIEDEEEELTLHEAEKEQEHCELMQPENIYKIERIDETE